ncbi:Von Willebrand factor type A domain protein [Enhygromyxa salina]|uniref:von Willebrand factor type A domain protein n=1 Tax=Enhygromyxa salina TaxID=215803 RepID=A0A0C2A0V8_9BACT|nr:VWA domain-containing protein [Enhygromyxa salina]KIG17033.1 Von Willebrand factor type A domain protein [Enhygromyxa salina]
MKRTQILFALAPLTLILGLAGCGDDAATADDGYGSYGEGGEGGDTSGGLTGGADEGDEGVVPDDEGAAEETDTDTETETGEPLCNDVDDVILYLSPDDSNSMSSPVQVRERVLKDGLGLGPVAIRPWEFMNYYSFDYAPAADGSLALSAELRVLEGFDAGSPHYQLQLAVTSEEMTDAERPPMNITLVLDTSGSMSGEPIELLKESCRAIAASLREGDKVSMVEWDTQNSWTLAGYAVTGPNDPQLLDKIEALAAGGGTDLNGGLVSGYDLAQQTWDIDALNRLVLISDGGANAGVTEVDLIAENANYGGSDGIYLVGAGVDLSGTYNDDLMDVVTDAGKGASVFITDEAEAWKTFNTNFISTMGLAARNVQVELTMPPGFEIVKFSGEEFSSDPKEVEPQHLAPNDSMVFLQEVTTCAPELVDADAEFTVTATWEDVSSFESVEVSQTYSFAQLLDTDASRMAKGAAIIAYVDALIAIKNVNGDGPQVEDDARVAANAAIAAAQALLPGDADLEEIAAILQAL